MKLTAKTRKKLAEVARLMNEAMMSSSDPMFYYESMLEYVNEIEHTLSTCITAMKPALDEIEHLQYNSPHGTDEDWMMIVDDIDSVLTRIQDYRDSIQTMYESASGAIIEAKKKKATKTKTRKYKGKEYTASAGSIVSLAKSGGSKKKAVGAGAFDWATEPYAAARAAEIVTTGKTRDK